MYRAFPGLGFRAFRLGFRAFPGLGFRAFPGLGFKFKSPERDRMPWRTAVTVTVSHRSDRMVKQDLAEWI